MAKTRRTALQELDELITWAGGYMASHDLETGIEFERKARMKLSRMARHVRPRQRSRSK